MLNVQQITATLARLGDQQLQQYAALHKNDPYILSLALGESNRRKQVRDGAHMQAAQQPKIVDQAVASMAAPMPEDVGIGQLPAENMQRMAGGGIVAFEEGGDVPRFQVGGTYPAFQYAPQGYDVEASRALQANNPMNAPMQRIWDAVASIWQDPRLSFNAKKQAEAALLSKAAGEKFDPTTMATAGDGALPVPQVAPAVADQAAPTVAPQQTQAERLADLQKQLAVLTGGAKPAGGGGGLPDLSAANLLKERDAMIPKIGVPAPIQSMITEYEDAARQAKQSELDSYSAYLKDRGPAFADREKRLQERGERIAEQEKQLVPMSLLEAGLAIMGGTSPRALENLAKGQKGVESYKSGLEKLGAARDKLDDAFGQIEEFRRNEANMDEKEIRRMKAEINQTAVEAKKMALNASMENFKLDKDSANQLVQKLYQAKVEIYKEGQQNARSQQAAGIEMLKMAQPPSELRYIQGLTESDLEKLQKISAAKAAPKTEQDFRQDWAKSAVLRAQYPDVNDFVRMMKGTAAMQSGQQLNASDAALINKYLKQ